MREVEDHRGEVVQVVCHGDVVWEGSYGFL